MEAILNMLDKVFTFVLNLLKQIFSFTEPKMTTAIYGGSYEKETVTCEHYWICEDGSLTHEID